MNRLKWAIPVLLAGSISTFAGCAEKAQTPLSPPSQVNVPPLDNPHAGMTRRDLLGLSTLVQGNALNGALLFNTPLSKAFPGILTSNNRSCATCHLAGSFLSLAPTDIPNIPSSDPLFTGIMADAGPGDTEAMLRDKLVNFALIRINLPNPNYDPSLGVAENNQPLTQLWRSVPTAFNSGNAVPVDLALANGGTRHGVIMWDLREPSLESQAIGASRGHAQVLGPIPSNVAGDIAAFERLNLSLPPLIALPGYPSQKPVLNTNFSKSSPFFGAPVFDYATVQARFFNTVKLTTPAQTRGMYVFTGTPQKPACIVCHNQPETLAGGTFAFRSARVSEENKHNLPLHTLRLKDFDALGNTIWREAVTADPGVAGITGLYKDLNKFKVAQLRGISKARRFFHDNNEPDLPAVIEHYEEVFPAIFSFTPKERADLLEFLKAL